MGAGNHQGLPLVSVSVRILKPLEQNVYYAAVTITWNRSGYCHLF